MSLVRGLTRFEHPFPGLTRFARNRGLTRFACTVKPPFSGKTSQTWEGTSQTWEGVLKTSPSKETDSTIPVLAVWAVCPYLR